MKDKNAVILGKKGGKASMSKLTKEQRSILAKKAAQARWKKYYETNPQKT